MRRLRGNKWALKMADSMADRGAERRFGGSPGFFGKKRSMMADAEDADPRFSKRREAAAPKGVFGGKPKKRPRIAFTGEEYGFGYQAAEAFLKRARDNGDVADGGVKGVNARTEREFDAPSKNSRFDYFADAPQPLRTKEQAIMAVKSQTADFAIVPFYSPYAGYDFETLRALGSMFTVLGVEQVEATDTLCLAVHESQLFDIIQSAHPGTAFSALQRGRRKSWGGVDSGSGNSPGGDYEAEMPRAGLPFDMADQKLIRDRIDTVFAGPEAARRCKSKLDGLRAIGVDVQEIPHMVEPHRELAKLARSATNPSRQTNTFFDASTGDTRFFSSLGAETQTGSLYGMLLPYEVAMRSSDYQIIDHNFDDASPAKTRFAVIENNPDNSLFEDKYRTTDARTAYWVRRLETIARPHGALGAGLMQLGGAFLGVAALVLLAFGFYGVSAAATASVQLPSSLSWVTSLTASGAIVLGGVAALVAFIMTSVRSAGRRGVRVMFRFRRDGVAASIGDVENFLRNFGVPHAVVRMDEDSERDAPASIMLDVEFDGRDFSYGPFAMLTRRLRGSVVNGALKKAFQRWKKRGVIVLAAMPIEEGQGQLPRHKPRQWWSHAVGAWAADAVETWFIRLSRILFIWVLPAAAVIFLVWRYLLNG